MLGMSASFAVASSTDCGTGNVAPYFSIRSQSVNQPRVMAGWVDHVHRFDMEKFYGSFALTPGYSQSFRDKEIAQCLFGSALQNCNDCPQLKISGSNVANRGSCDLLADYFGLPRGYQSSVTFEPKIKTFFLDFVLHVGLDEWVSGMWFRAWAPFVHTNWDLNVCETRSSSSTREAHTAGYFTSASVPESGLLNSALEFFRERKVPTLPNAANATPSSVSFESLRSCRWGDCGCDGDVTENGLADLRVALGWNFFQDEDYHIGLGIIAAAPTGNRPEGCFLFEPMVGNGNHWEVGGLWTSHVIFWRSEDEEKHFGGYLDANITHLFKTRQKRCFDLCGKPLSRYMLAAKMSSTVSGLAGAELIAANDDNTTRTAVAPSHQFTNGYAPVGNLTCSDVDVSVGVQADVVAMLNYTSGGFSFDLGYNLWARSCEKIEFDCDCPPRLAKSTELWALKGDAQVYGWVNNNTTPSVTPRALSATQSAATIFKGNNQTAGSALDLPTTNRTGTGLGTNLDNNQFAQIDLDGTGAMIQRAAANATGDVNEQIGTSVNPVLLKQSDINLNGARTRGLSHSVFAHFSYSWLNNQDWTPFLGIGIQAEFSNNSGDCKTSCNTSSSTSSCSTSCDTSNNCNTKCDDCIRCSVSQWAVFVKGGVSFN